MRILRLPSLAENIEEATLVRWRVSAGQAVAAGDPLAELVTEKASFDYETDRAETITHLLAPPGSVLPVGYAIALAEATEGEALAARRDNEALLARHARSLAGAPPPADSASAAPGGTASAAPGGTAAAVGGGAARATPAARRLAKELGVALEAAAARHPGVLLKEEHIRAFAREP